MFKAIIILFLMISFAHASECIPSETSCEFYKCLESKKNCGEKGFLINLGHRYCENFLDDIPVSSEGADWLLKTRVCLQQKLLKQSNLRCSEYKSASVSDHVKCYVDNGYCDLPESDKYEVKKLALKEFIHSPGYLISNYIHMIRFGCVNR
jgi:hypothetical protein